jgi:5-dehydro-2-deoxygluconokinase
LGYEAGVFPGGWMLPSPASGEEWERLSAAVGRRDRHCRGILLLAQEAGEAALRESFRRAAPFDVCQGFAVGWPIFSDVAERWFGGALQDAEAVALVAKRYERLIRLWDEIRGPDGGNGARRRLG